jgi:hypothetical protein
VLDLHELDTNGFWKRNPVGTQATRRRQPGSRWEGEAENMFVILLGAPESGKTTQALRLEAALGLAKLHIADVTLPGGGGRQSDRELAEAVANLAADISVSAGTTLEGFPTTVAQAQALDAALSAKGMKVSTVVYIDVGENEWLDQADPVLSLYYDRGILASVDGRPFVEAVEEQIMAAVAGAKSAAPQPYVQLQPAADTKAAADAELMETVRSVQWIDPRRSVGGFQIGASTSLLPTTKASKTVTSNWRWREDMHKHDRVKLAPSQKYAAPVAASMDIGWDARNPELYKKDPDLFHPRMKSRETMYAEALILGPRHP